MKLLPKNELKITNIVLNRVIQMNLKESIIDEELLLEILLDACFEVFPTHEQEFILDVQEYMFDQLNIG